MLSVPSDRTITSTLAERGIALVSGKYGRLDGDEAVCISLAAKMVS
jgi:hypothetical protein